MLQFKKQQRKCKAFRNWSKQNTIVTIIKNNFSLNLNPNAALNFQIADKYFSYIEIICSTTSFTSSLNLSIIY
jgi:hypothetical protein